MIRKRPYKKRALKALKRRAENPNPRRHHHHKQIRRLHSPRLPVHHLFPHHLPLFEGVLVIDKLPEWIVSIKLFVRFVSRRTC